MTVLIAENAKFMQKNLETSKKKCKKSTDLVIKKI